MPIVLSAEPVAKTYSDAGLNDKAFIASWWPSLPLVTDEVVEALRVSRICRVKSSDTVPRRAECKG